ncbi:MAG: threonine ammonia-lyase [Thermomicrobiales bacterium]
MTAPARSGDIPVTLDDIRDAHALLSGEKDYLPGRRERVALKTPLIYADSFSRQFGCRVWLKLESLQKTGSYKIRGAFNTIAHLPPERRGRGVVTASAGNHAQGVAYAARAFGIAERTTIFVPRGTPTVKKENTRSYGVAIEETGATFDEARETAYREAERSDRPFIEPFDDWRTIAGQGTIGLEIVDDLPTVRAIVAPVGGGGMIAGVAIAARALCADVRIIGAQAIGADSMIRSLNRGEAVRLPGPPDTEIADGIKVSAPGLRPFIVARELLDARSFVTVADHETIAAVADLLLWSKVVAEGAGAIVLAALRTIQEGRSATIEPFGAADDVVVIVSGANIDPSFSWRILYERSVPNLMTIRIPIPDRPGELLRLLEPINALRINIIDVDVNRHDARPRMGERVVELCIAINGPAEKAALLDALGAHNYAPQYSRWHDGPV